MGKTQRHEDTKTHSFFSENRWGTLFHYDNRIEAETFSINLRGADENYLSTFDIDDMTIWIFILELAVIFLIVLITVGYELVKSAIRNPVNSLRTE